MDNSSVEKGDLGGADIQINTMPSSSYDSAPKIPEPRPALKPEPVVSSLEPKASISSTLARPGSTMEPMLASRVNRSAKSNRHLDIKLAVIIALIVLFLGGGAYAWFFTDLKYKLPWFRPSEDKLVGLMYENLAKLDGADFALTYKLSVGDRDKDVVVDEKKISDQEAVDRASDLKSKMSYSYKSSIASCHSQGLNLQAFTAKNCDGSAEAKPKAGESFCAPAVNPIDSDTDFGADVVARLGKWDDLSKYEWEYDGACTSDATKKTYSFSLHSTYNDDKITCNEKSCEWNNEDLMGFDNENSTMDFELLFGTYLDGLDDYISTNFNLAATLSGSGFSLKDRATEKKQLPDVGLGFAGQADLGSMNGKVKMEARVVDDAMYYQVSDFPFTDITQGYEDQWIKMDAEDDTWLSDLVPEFSDKQNQAIIDFRNFIAKTKDYNVLTFKFAGDFIEKDGLKTPVFEVNLIPENVPSWLQDLRDLYTKNQEADSVVSIESKQYSEAEKTKIIAKTKELMTNMKIKAALHPGTGDLLNFTVDFRIIPSSDSKKFADKQFNSSLSVDLWNHNKPSAPKVPDNFVEQSEIEREKLGYSKEAYQDIKQAKRITRIRKDLLSYYNEHKTWPKKLEEATKSVIDYNTGQEYLYEVVGSNYIITYQMSDVEQKAEPKNNNDKYFGYNEINGFGQNALTKVKESWDKGENKADRYSPVAHKYVSSRQWLVADVQVFDSDVLLALAQAKMLKNLGDQIDYFYEKNNHYPDNLGELTSVPTELLISTKTNSTYICEDLLLAKPCDYQKQDGGYTVKVNFKLSLDNIDKDIINYNKYSAVPFQSGLNQYDAISLQKDLSSSSNYDQYTDSDKDGLSDVDELKYGTNKYDNDSDNDGFLDGEEVKNGYNPKGSGKLIEPVKGTTASIEANDWVKGDAKALVSLIIYSDADCPFCVKFHATINQILKDYKGKIKVAYRHFPIRSLHPEAPKKAEAIECVGELGGNEKVWAFLDKLFVSSKPTLAQLDTIAQSIGVDKTKFKTCLDSGKYATKIATHISVAQTLGAQGTPYSLLIKGSDSTVINGAYSYEQLKVLIDKLLK